ncbi:MAG: ATP-binding protein [Syntrophomonadaceae bacterium]|nr:ATP-binding protein [Syntrophomonadaceae bacterium]MDD3022323.1 ATP-binding protein [Syntrophomonadaceae bacterium]
MFEFICNRLAGLTIYRNILQDSIVHELKVLANHSIDFGEKSRQTIESYHKLAFLIYQGDCSFQEHLIKLILHDDNPFSQEAEWCPEQDIKVSLKKAAEQDLAILHEIFHLDIRTLAGKLGVNSDIMPWRMHSEDTNTESMEHKLNTAANWPAQIDTLAKHYSRYSRGRLSSYKALRWDGRELVGVEYPDPVRLDDLVGYDLQKNELCRNTEIFLNGFPANNALIYGSRGTGKSTMVKALLNEYADSRLRLVEVRREQIKDLPQVVSILRKYSVKSIVFVDDLSFEDYETEYKGLKAVMEGSLESRPGNVLIYATSNRRHLVREFFSDRGKVTDEIHAHDTMQEKLSLADRFGLTVTFPTPDQKLYLEIVEKYVKERPLAIDAELLRRKALEWEKLHHGPSGRTARQFVDSLGTRL